jgi:membrane associated rhomboid family serine protease
LRSCFPAIRSQRAGLVKPAYHAGQWWRLLTAPFLHGNLIHFLLNAAALLYLGKRVEVFARWPHVPLVFLFSACVGGELSARFVPGTSVGASGGLMGLLGFLLVFESLHSRLVPRSASRRLLAGVLLTAVIGLVGYRFIDNAAHAGGLIAGMLYAIVVFPKSASSYRPNATISDRVAGIGALVLLTLSALFAVFLIAIR